MAKARRSILGRPACGRKKRVGCVTNLSVPLLVGPLENHRHVRLMNYIPHYTKKKQQLARRKAALVRLLNSDASVTKLLAAAEEVRAAKVRVLRAQRATLAPTDRNTEQFERVDARIAEVEQQTAAELLRQTCQDLR